MHAAVVWHTASGFSVGKNVAVQGTDASFALDLLEPPPASALIPASNFGGASASWSASTKIAVATVVAYDDSNGNATLDLSQSGMDVLAAQPLFPAALIGLRFTLPASSMEVDAHAEVAWANPNGQSGVRFLDLPAAQLEALNAWLLVNSPEVPPEEAEREPSSPYSAVTSTAPASAEAAYAVGRASARYQWGFEAGRVDGDGGRGATSSSVSGSGRSTG